LSPRIAVDATRLPEPFHRDPADRLLVATARTFGVPMLTVDAAIREYPHVVTP
jgi:PIN domain nuclease of toxin-antitoxin system